MKRTIEIIRKLVLILKSPGLYPFILKNIAPSVEHRKVLADLPLFNTIVDIGANKGQFASIASIIYPKSKIFSFEPLTHPSSIFKKAFRNDLKIKLFECAIGPAYGEIIFHVSKKDDSSSILPISSLQSKYFHGTEEKETINVKIGPLSEFIKESEIFRPALLKIDVQGYELEVLKGSESLLAFFDYVYVECSFLELYENQALAHQVISHLSSKNHELIGVYNISYDKNGRAIQGDFLFKKSSTLY